MTATQTAGQPRLKVFELTPPELAAWAAQPAVTVHRYRLYWQSVAPFLLGACALLTAALWRGLHHGLQGATNIGLIALLLAFSAWAVWVAIYWTMFPKRVFVARTDTDLVLVDGSKSWRIPLSELQRETIHRDSLKQSQRTAKLPLHIGGHRFSILLFGHFVKLENHLALVAALLEVIMQRSKSET